MHTFHRYYMSTLGLLLCCLFMLSCSKENDIYIVAPASVESTVEAGWSDYTLGRFESAAIKFETAINQNAAYYDAYNGLGWSYFRQGEYDLAISYFQFLIPLRDLEPEMAADAYAGMAVVYMTQNRDVDALMSAWKVLEIKGESYVFQHDPTITSEDIHILAARCLYNIEEFFLCQVEISAVEPDFPPPSVLPSTTVIETVAGTHALEIDLSYEASTPVLQFETDERDVISIASITDTSGLVPYDIAYGYGEGGEFYLTADPLPPVRTQFIVEYTYVDDYNAYLIALAQKIEEMVAY